MHLDEMNKKCINAVLFNLDVAKFWLLVFTLEYLTDYYHKPKVVSKYYVQICPLNAFS